METSSNLAQYSEDIMDRLGNDNDHDLTNMMITDDVLDSDLYMDNEESVYNEPDDVIIVHMDIREELRTLQKLVEQKIGLDLTGYKFWLQDAQELEPHKNLVDQCVKGEGLVQINVQIQTINQRINIMDVLKPTEAALAALASVENEVNKELEDNNDDDELESDSNAGQDENSNPLYNVENKPCVNWIRDQKFRREQARLKIPEDPMLWEVSHVKHWFQWAVQEFNLTGYKLNDWSINGEELCSLTHEEFREKLPNDPGNVFYTHIQLLKECKFVSVVDKERESVVTEDNYYTMDNIDMPDDDYKIMRKSHFQKTKRSTSSDANNSNISSMILPINAGIGSGNNGQIQLWQFLLDLLTDRSHCGIIQWVGVDGEFRLTDPEQVARLWGFKKNKPAMNYEKLSRALRYYYDGDMISKVSGKRFAYKFDCDLKLLIGYDAGELSKLVNIKGTSTNEFDSEINVKNDSD